MNNTQHELLCELERLAWEISTTDKEKISSIQNLLYQWDQMQDAQTPNLVDWSGDLTVGKHYEEEHLVDGFTRG